MTYLSSSRLTSRHKQLHEKLLQHANEKDGQTTFYNTPNTIPCLVYSNKENYFIIVLLYSDQVQPLSSKIVKKFSLS